MPSLNKYLGAISHIPRSLRTNVSPLSLVLGSSLHPTVALKSATRVHQSAIDRYSYLGRDCLVMGADIGSFCSIADYCVIGSAVHELEWASTSPVFQGAANVMRVGFAEKGFPELARTTVGHDVWIGIRSTILGGVTVGTGAVVGAGSIVTKDVPPYAIVAGAPARAIKYRFADPVIHALLDSEWWTLPESALRSIGPLADNPHEFARAAADARGVDNH